RRCRGERVQTSLQGPDRGPASSALDGATVRRLQIELVHSPTARNTVRAMQPLDLSSIDRLLTTPKAVRKRLDLSRPVPRDVLVECLRLACHAPNASNAQQGRWGVVDDPEQR